MSIDRCWAMSSAVEDRRPSSMREARRARSKSSRRLRVFVLFGSLATVVVATPFVEEQLRSFDRARNLETCRGRLAKVSTAFLTTTSQGRGELALPPAAIVSKDGKPLLSRRVALLPALGYQSVHDQFALDEPWDSPRNRALIPLMPVEFACPAGEPASTGRTHLRLFVGNADPLDTPKPAFDWTRRVDFREFSDGTSSTILMLETKESVIWTQPDAIEFKTDQAAYELASPHTVGAFVIFVDGSIRLLRKETDPNAFRSFITRDGGEVIGDS